MPETLDMWQGSYPRISYRRRTLDSGMNVIDPLLLTQLESTNLSKWQPTYPSILLRKKWIQPIVICFVNTTGKETVELDKWIPVYPSRLDRKKRTSIVNWFTTDPKLLANHESLTLDKWTPSYPSRLDRSKRVYPLDWTVTDSNLLAIAPSSIENYLRRYLNDPTSLTPEGPSVSPASGTETDDVIYFRRYLVDKVVL